jgi:hypothetical protein
LRAEKKAAREARIDVQLAQAEAEKALAAHSAELEECEKSASARELAAIRAEGRLAEWKKRIDEFQANENARRASENARQNARRYEKYPSGLVRDWGPSGKPDDELPGDAHFRDIASPGFVASAPEPSHVEPIDGSGHTLTRSVPVEPRPRRSMRRVSPDA